MKTISRTSSKEVKLQSSLIQEALGYLLDDPTLWPARREYIRDELVAEKERYIKELLPEAVCYDIILKDTRREIKSLKKRKFR